MTDRSRRDFLKLVSVGGVVFASGLAGARARRGGEEFTFLQLSDTHWGFRGPPNPLADVTLPRAIAAINSVERAPDFIVFTGDLTHTTDDAQERRRRMAEFKRLAATLRVPALHFLPGEHDASLDAGAAYEENFGETRYSFDHKGIHFVAIDNVSDPGGAVGDSQIDWLAKDLSRQNRDSPIVVFTHRPLFDLYPAWDWATRDGAKVIDVLSRFRHVTVFYGHIHQEHHVKTDHIAHHAARSLIFALPPPGSAPKRAPLPWNDAKPFDGLGYRRVREAGDADPLATEVPLTVEKSDATTVRITAKKWAYEPSTITLRKDVPVVLELVSLDRAHGFFAPELGLRADVKPGEPARVPITPRALGSFAFRCDVFCGDGHEDMNGRIIVVP